MRRDIERANTGNVAAESKHKSNADRCFSSFPCFYFTIVYCMNMTRRSVKVRKNQGTATSFMISIHQPYIALRTFHLTLVPIYE